jgi:hypothetical protein
MNTTLTLRAPRFRVAAILLGLVIAAGCAKKPEQDASFKTPEEAVAALVAALQKDDVAGLQALLGPGSEELLNSGDAVQDASDRAAFLAAYQARHALTDDGDRSQDPGRRRGRMADADPDREARRGLAVRRRGGHRRDDLPPRRRQRTRRHRRLPRLRQRAARVCVGGPRRRRPRHLRTQARQ